MKTEFAPLALCGALLALAGCTDMKDQPRYDTFEASGFYADGQSARLPVEGTVPRGHLRDDDHLYRGLDENGDFAADFPMTVDLALLERGQERYDIFCSPCHDRSGDGDGMIVRRGYQRPPSFHEQRLRDSAPGYVYDVISNGFGVMASYASQIPVEDRWAIVAYLKALQLRRSIPLDELPADLRTRVAGGEVVGPPQPAEEADDGHH